MAPFACASAVNIPDVHQKMDSVFLAAKNTYKAGKARVSKATDMSVVERARERQELSKVFNAALTLYDQQLEQRAKYQLLRKGHMTPDGTRRYIIPTDAPGYAKWKARAGAHQGKTVSMLLPSLEEAERDKNAGGLKMEQYFAYGTPEWRRAYAMRNVVEGANSNLKRPQHEAIDIPGFRAVRGNTFTYLIAAVAAVIENLRQILRFFQRKLALKPLSSKNRAFASTYWNEELTVDTRETVPPPME